MKEFMGNDFLLQNNTAKELFEAAKDMPIFDYHCHLIPSEIESNKRFDSIVDVWLGGDHYKWRQMRTFGHDEKLITGDADPYDKFYAWAQTMENLIGNPLYHWTHLELQRYFDIKLPLNTKNAKTIYQITNEKLQNDKDLDVYGIMNKFNVHTVGTTDDPIDSLEYHKKIMDRGDLKTNVLPSFRPDKAIIIEKDTFIDYINKLAKVANVDIKNVNDVVVALVNRLDYFVENGCKATDHGLSNIPAVFLSENEVNEIFKKRMNNEAITLVEAEAYSSYILLNLAREYHKRNIVMQLHISALRDNNTRMFKLLGPDTGYDSSHDNNVASKVSLFLNELEKTNQLPKTILYSLNPKDYYSLGTLLGCFQGDNIRNKVQLGSAWWFLDHKDGMEEQMKILANLSMLPNFVGMLTDSRSFLSYPRHEYFRRIMCNLIGTWVENGEVYNDKELLSKIVKDISFNNVEKYFN
ncbi:MAG: glucuronate isomerase [Pleomorphochaeta sp.]